MKIPAFIDRLVAYKPGKPIEETQREYGLSHVYKLASNENPLGPSPNVIQAVIKSLNNQHLYPDPSQFELLRQAALFWQMPTSNISFGNGTDEIIDFLVRIFCEPGDQILFPLYSFQAYEVTAGACRVRIKTAALKGWQFSSENLIQSYNECNPKPKIIFIANPNNPTGTYIPYLELERTIEYFAGKDTLVVLDEAYFEFARANDYKSMKSLVLKMDHLVVLRTFSKIFGMAGLRLGAMLAPENITIAYNKMRKPFNVSGVAQVAGIAAMQDLDFIHKTQAVTWSGLDYFYKELNRLKIPFVESQGNFVLMDTGSDAKSVFEQLLKLGIILRPVANYGLPRHLRMSAGLAHENEAAIQALERVLAQGRVR